MLIPETFASSCVHIYGAESRSEIFMQRLENIMQSISRVDQTLLSILQNYSATRAGRDRARERERERKG